MMTNCKEITTYLFSYILIIFKTLEIKKYFINIENKWTIKQLVSSKDETVSKNFFNFL